MIELLPVLTPLFLMDVLNPVLFAVMIAALGSSRPIATSTSLLAGHTVAYFFAGIVIALGLQEITGRIANPHPVDYLMSAAIGVLCLWAVFKSRESPASQEKPPAGKLTPLRCFGMGAVINVIGIPFAVPYLAVLDQILKANLSLQSSVLTLGAYNVAYALPFAVVPLLRIVMGEQCIPYLERFNAILGKLADALLPIILLLLGLALISDAVLFFWTGDGLI